MVGGICLCKGWNLKEGGCKVWDFQGRLVYTAARRLFYHMEGDLSGMGMISRNTFASKWVEEMVIIWLDRWGGDDTLCTLFVYFLFGVERGRFRGRFCLSFDT